MNFLYNFWNSFLKIVLRIALFFFYFYKIIFYINKLYIILYDSNHYMDNIKNIKNLIKQNYIKSV